MRKEKRKGGVLLLENAKARGDRRLGGRETSDVSEIFN
jgi:hypothetical protein